MIFECIPGAPTSPVILHVPHASRALTAEARATLLISDAELTEELNHLTDAHTDTIAQHAAQTAAPRPWIFRHRWSRLVVDPERFPDDREEMQAVGMGAVYTHGFAGRKLRNSVRDDPAPQKHYDSYATAVSQVVTQRLAACGHAVILDVHSYPSAPLPYELHPTGPRPPVCLGTDPFHTPPILIAAATEAFGEVALNTPFAGCYVPLPFHRRDPRVTALMLEFRRDTYMTEPGGPPTPALPHLANALASVINAASAT